MTSLSQSLPIYSSQSREGKKYPEIRKTDFKDTETLKGIPTLKSGGGGKE